MQFFEHGLPSHRRELANKLFGHVLTLSLQMYGCRVIQKVLLVLSWTPYYLLSTIEPDIPAKIISVYSSATSIGCLVVLEELI